MILPLLSSVFVLLSLLNLKCEAFAPSPSPLLVRQIKITSNNPPQRSRIAIPRLTTLHNGVIMDVDDNFFTATFFTIGLIYSLGKAYNR